MIDAVLMMGGLGIVIGSGLAAASKIFYVYVDPLVEKIDDLLPGRIAEVAVIRDADRTQQRLLPEKHRRLPVLRAAPTSPKPSQLSWE